MLKKLFLLWKQAAEVLYFVVIATAAFQDHFMFFISDHCISSMPAFGVSDINLKLIFILVF
jgi:hypothetical protein